MSLLFRPRPTQARSLSYQDVWGSGGNWDSTGNLIGGPDVVSNGLRLIPVYAATSLISDLIATSPLSMYSKATDGAMSLMPKQPQIITDPYPYGGAISWRHQCVSSMLLRGNAFGYVTALGSDGWPSQIIWLNPDAVTVIEEQNDWFHTPSFAWRGRPLNPDLVVHIPAYTMPGSVLGYSPLGLFKLQISTGLEAQQFANDWFKNSANPSGTLKNSAKVIEPEAADNVKRKFKAAIANRDVFVTGNDWDYKSLTVAANESQFLETIKATATQIAAIYRLLPEDIGGETGSSLTYKTLSQDATRLVTRGLQPWAARIEEVLSNLRPRPQFAKFDLGKLTKGDRTTSTSAHAAAISAGLETLDEARADDDKPPMTPEQLAFWLKNIKGGGGAAPAAPNASPTEGGEPA